MGKFKIASLKPIILVNTKRVNIRSAVAHALGILDMDEVITDLVVEVDGDELEVRYSKMSDSEIEEAILKPPAGA
ncbi:MAG: hypothetical protein AAF544_01305 [Bacteroidota bacterium]